MTEKKESFWTTLPGILTGIAAILTAGTGLYQYVKPRAVEPPRPINKTTSPTDWPLVALESFSLVPWDTGHYPNESTSVAQFAIADGVYRWTLEFAKEADRYIEAPYGPAVEFSLTVDAKLTQSTPQQAALGVIFGLAEGRGYGFKVSTNRHFQVAKYAGNQSTILIPWTPLPDFDSTKFNKLGVSVAENDRIRVYLNSSVLGEFKDPGYTGGKIGLQVSGDEGTKVLAEFDNFEFRRKALP